MIEIRRLTPSDAHSYREIRLEALQYSPEAYGSTFETESAQPLAYFHNRLERASIFGAFLDSDLIGVAALVVGEGIKESHKGFLVGMYVRPWTRKAGAGQLLVEAILRSASGCVEIVQLGVVSDNEQARNLYSRLGFLEYGLEKNALKQNGRYYDEILMAKALKLDEPLGIDET